jgi:hypothetical protein
LLSNLYNYPFLHDINYLPAVGSLLTKGKNLHFL